VPSPEISSVADPSAIRAVLFDFGGVILSSPFEAFNAYERAHGLPGGFLRSVNATNPDTNAWARLERSEVSLEQFAGEFEAEALAAGHSVDAAEILSLLEGDLRPEMVRALEVLHGDDRWLTGLLTNNFLTGGGHADRWPQLSAVLDDFDLVLESSRVGVRKPDPRFYDQACEALSIEPHEAVFLDDLGINLKPARAMGMTTIKVVDHHVALAELESVLGTSLV
jgi:putative hydrolase of the HAD superfamily